MLTISDKTSHTLQVGSAALLFCGILFFEAGDISLSANTDEPKTSDKVSVWTSSKSYFRYELVRMSASLKHGRTIIQSNVQVRARIYYKDVLVRTIADTSTINLVFNRTNGFWEGRWPVPWNPPLGEYELILFAQPEVSGMIEQAKTWFKIKAVDPPPVPDSLCIMNLETAYNITNTVWEGPDGQSGDHRQLVSWARYMGADAVFSLTGISDGIFRKNLGALSMYRPDVLLFSGRLSSEVQKAGLKFGAWIMSYMLGLKISNQLGYQHSLGYNSSSNFLMSGPHISLADKKRLDDIILLVKQLDSDPRVNYIGLDYIRTGSGEGYELVDEVASEMDLPLPADWKDFSVTQRRVWFAKKIALERDKECLEKWDWWRAHKVALIVHEIITKSGIHKPLWVFTLGWEHGKQHGQDPFMLVDAGVTYDAVMLYESQTPQFRQIVEDWKAYAANRELNLICGEEVDTDFLDSSYLTPPEEMVRRTSVGSSQMLFRGLAQGVFWHDISRAFWGRRGEFSTKEWCITGGTCFSRFREQKGLVPLSLKIDGPLSVKKNSKFPVTVRIENIGQTTVRNIVVSVETVEKLKCSAGPVLVDNLQAGEEKDITFGLELQNSARTHLLLPVRVSYEKDMSIFDFTMLEVK